MKITTKLTLEYLKKNKRRSMVTIIRNSCCNCTYYNYINFIFKLPRVHGKYD